MKSLTLLITIFMLSILHINAQEGWGEVQKLTAANRFAGQHLGNDIDIDGDYAVVGGSSQPFNSYNEAYVFKKDNDGDWVELPILESPDYAPNDFFGNAVAISGNTILVGARANDTDEDENNTLSAAGAVYVYVRDAIGNWNFQQKLVASDRQELDQFGFVIDIDGDRAIIGLGQQSYDENGENYIINAGAAYVFERNGDGIWNEVQKIVASDRSDFDYFARNSVAIDNDYVVVGTRYEDHDQNGAEFMSSAGSAYIFKRDATGVWNEVQKVVASDRQQGDWFGFAVAMDGETFVVSANYEGIPGADATKAFGAAYIFELVENDIWVETQKIVASDRIRDDEFGTSIAIDGNRIISGTIGKSYDPNGTYSPYRGVAYVFEKDALGTWNQVQKFFALDGNQGDQLGYAVAVSGDIAMVSALLQDYDTLGTNYMPSTGAVYVLDANAEPLVSAFQCPYLQADYGSSCDDGNDLTENDVLNDECVCIGTLIPDCPELSANIGDSCDDGDATTTQDVVTENCECVGIVVYDCPDLSANIGDSCDDGNENTVGDAVTENCICEGSLTYDCEDLQANIGDSCDDNNTDTENDVITSDCECVGTVVYDCPDLSANIGDSCDDGNENTVGDAINETCDCEGSLTYDCEDLQANIGDSCDDNNSSTENDVVTSDCECVGTVVYDCPALSANIGDSCDDGNENTVGDAITETCTCEGSLTYDCEDLQANIGDSCDDNNSSTENDVITSDCECVGTVVYDCPDLSANIGDSCDDGNENTVGDAITENCICEGSLTYDCEDLQANIGDSCDDNNSSTENDVITSDCECVGTIVYDCPDLSANIGDSCDDNDSNTFNDAITETCECLGKTINPTDCQEVVYYLSDYSSNSGTDVYKVSLSQGIATLDYLANHPDEVHLAYSNAQNMLYAVSKSLNQYSTINPHAAILAFSAPYSLSGTYGEISGAAFAPNGDLYFCSQSTNMIHSLNVVTGVAQVADNFSPISGGDIAFGNDGTPYLVTNAYGGGLYETHPSSQMEDSFLAPLEGISTGMALSATDQLLVSTRNSSILTIWNTDGTMVDENYELILNGEQFILNYGDMASGCDTYDPITLETCMEHNTFYAEKNGNQTDIYAVNFDGTDANLSLLTSVDFEAAIAYRAINDALYMVSKTGSYIRTYHPATDTFSPDIYLSIQLNSITAAESERFATGLYIGDANTNGVYYVNPSTGETEFIISAEVFGGDLAISYFDSLYLASQSGNGLYQVGSETVNQVGSIPQGVTGAARTKFTSTILFSNYLATTFSEINIYDGALISTYNVKLNGQPFTLGYGDLAADCGVYFNRPSASDQFAGLLEYKSVLTSRPNPTSGASQVVFTTVETGRALVEVYDMKGRNVATLFNEEAQEGREYRIDFNGSNLPNGIYVYRLTTENETVIEKFMIAK